MYKVDFLENLKQNLVDTTVDELADFIVYLAKLLPNNLYSDVLAWFEQENTATSRANIDTKNLFDEIERLFNEIEDGRYEFEWDFDNDYGYYSDYYEDYEGDELIDKNGLGRHLTVLIPKIMNVANNEQYDEACQLFSQLFSISVYNDYGEDITIEQLFEYDLIQLDYRAVLLTYAHAILMCKQGVQRVNLLFGIVFGEQDFKLEPVLKFGSTPIPDETQFFRDWLEYLRNREVDKYRIKNRNSLLIDALTTSGGINALRNFVAEYGIKYAEVVFKLIELDIIAENFDQAVTTIKKAFTEIDGIDPNKTQLADYLIRIARITNDQANLRLGTIEGFKASLRLEYYGEIHTWQDADLIKEMLDYLDIHAKKDDFHYYCINFLNGNHELVWNECVMDTSALGWSNSLKGFMFPLFLATITKDSCGVLTTDMVNQLGNRLGYVQFAELLSDSKPILTDDRYQEYSKWCENQIGLRVDAIVTNQHRGAYDRAAELIVAMGEILMTNYNEPTGMNYILKFKQAYPRHNAFQRSLRENLALIGRAF